MNRNLTNFIKILENFTENLKGAADMVNEEGRNEEIGIAFMILINNLMGEEGE